MNKLNILFTLSSLSVLLVTIERFSFTAGVLLQPYNFLRLHELVQMTIIILITVIIPFLILKEVSDNFSFLKSRNGFLLTLLFVIGVYFYATGNGVHEMASFLFNNYCSVKNFSGNLCSGLFINDYYTGNVLYFIGGGLMVSSLLLIEKLNPTTKFNKKEMIILKINAVVYALAIFAYAAFDVVLVGITYSVIITAISLLIFISIRKNYLNYPVITYTTLTYILGTALAILVRFFR